MNKNKLPKKRIFFLLCSAVLLIVTLVPYSLGWFTFNKEAQTDGIGMKAVDCPFELITRGGEYSEDVPGHDLLKKIDAFDLGNANENKTENRTGKGSAVVEGETQDQFAYAMNWLLSDDSNFNNNSTNEEENYGLRPGSHGKLEFYIKPVEDKMPMTIVCKLAVIPYQIKEITTSENDVETTKTVYQQIDTDSSCTRAIDFLKGHILFFKSYDEDHNVYENPITINAAGNVQFEVPINVETLDSESKEVKVDLYWIWPRTLPELLLDSNDQNLLGRQNLLADIPASSDGASAKEIIVAMMESKGSYFFPTDTNISENLISNIAHNQVYPKAEYIDLCSAYNQADQYIGLNVQFVVLNLACSVKNSG